MRDLHSLDFLTTSCENLFIFTIQGTHTAFVDQPVKTFDFYIQLNEMFVPSIKNLKTGRRKASTVTSNKDDKNDT